MASRAGRWIADQKRLLCTTCYGEEARLAAERPETVFHKRSLGTSKVRLLWAPRQRIVLVLPLDTNVKCIEALRTACKRAGCDYDKQRGHYAPFERVALLVRELEEEGLTVELVPELVLEVEKQAAEVRRLASVGAMRAERFAQFVKARTGKALRNYQKIGIQFLASNPFAILADDGGLGKSIQVLGALGPNPRCLVVAPAVMRGAYVGRGKDKAPRGGWADEARKWLGDAVRVTILEGRNSFRWPEPNEIVITGYDTLPRAFGERGKNLPSEAPPCPPGVTIVADEAQNLSSSTSLRSRRFVNLIRRAVEAGDARAWGITATPLNNEPKELWQVLGCFRLAEAVFGSFDNFVRLHNCSAKQVGYNKFQVEWNEPAPEVAERLKRYMLRRRKRDVLTELPPISFETVVVEVDKKTLALCDKALSEIEKSGLDLAQALELLEESRHGIDFTKISAALEALGRAKLPAALEYVKLYESRKEPVVFFASHVAPVEAVGARKGWAMVVGETATVNKEGAPKTVKRNEAIRMFQEGEVDHGFCSTIQSTGTGATLTRASRAFFHSRLWSATKNAQAVWRIERIGQENAMTVTNLVGNHPLDVRMAELLEKKAALYASSVDAASVAQEELNKPKLARAQELESITNRVVRQDLQQMRKPDPSAP